MIFFLVISESSEYEKTIYFKRNESIIDKYNIDNLNYEPFLTDIQFGKYYFNTYGNTGEPGKKCYVGSCDNQKDFRSKNCSEVCAISGSICEVDNKTCSRIYCQQTQHEETYGVCHYYNVIYYWRGQKMNLTTTNFYFLLVTGKVLYNESCREGYKQCGYLNKEKDKLCIDANKNCPINKVIIKNDTIAPTDFNYTMRPIGDKYLFYTTENTNNSLYINIIADSEIIPTNYTEIIDNQSLSDFIKENPYIYDGNYTSKSTEELSKYGDAKLKMVENLNQTSLIELRKIQAKYTERLALYPEEKLKEMNENVAKYKNLLIGFSITEIVYFFVIGTILCGCIAGKLGESPLKTILIVYLAFFPGIFFNIYSFILTILNKKTYSQYYSMKYINDFMNWEVVWKHNQGCDENGICWDDWTSKNICLFDDISYYNNASFICYIIKTVFMILYPIIIVFIYRSDCVCYKTSENEDKNQKLSECADLKAAGISKSSDGY